MARAENLGILAKLYPNHTATYFTEAFGNVMYNKSKSGSKFQSLNSLEFNWEIEVSKRIAHISVYIKTLLNSLNCWEVLVIGQSAAWA